MGTMTSKLVLTLQDDLTKRAGQISGQVSKLASDLARSQKQIGSVDLLRNSLQSLGTARTRMAEAQKNVEGLARQLRDAKKAAAEVASPEANRKLKELSSAFTRAEREVKRAAASYDKMAQSAKAAKEAFTGGNAITSIANHERNLRASIDASTAALRRQEQAARRRAAIMDVTKTAVGSAALVGGYAGVRTAGRAVHAANDYSASRVGLVTSGMNSNDVLQAELSASALSAKYPTVSRGQILDQIRSQVAVTGDFHHAMEAIEDNVRLRMVAQAKRPGEDVSHGFELLNKAMEIGGYTANPEKHHRAMNSLAKMMNFFGGTLRFEDISDAIKYAGSSGTGLSERFFSSVLPTIASELGGSTAGTSLATSYQQIVGGRMKTAAARNLNEYGLLDRKNIEYDKVGQVKRVKPGGVKGSSLFMTDPDKWVSDYLEPALAAKGVTELDDKKKAIAGMFPERNTQRMVELLLLQKARLEKDAIGVGKAQGLEASDTLKNEDTGTAIKSLSTAFDNLLQTLSGPVLQQAIPALNKLTAGLNALSDIAKDHPMLAGAAGVAALGGSAALAKGGLSWLLDGAGLKTSAAALDKAAVDLSAAAARLGGGPGGVPPGEKPAGTGKPGEGGKPAEAPKGAPNAPGAGVGPLGGLAGGILGWLAYSYGAEAIDRLLRPNPQKLQGWKEKGYSPEDGGGMRGFEALKTLLEKYLTMQPAKGGETEDIGKAFTGIGDRLRGQLAPAISEAAAEAGRQGSSSLIAGFDLSGFRTTGDQAGSSTRGGFLGADFAGAGSQAGQSLLSSFRAATAAMSLGPPKTTTPGRASGGHVSAGHIYRVGEGGNGETFVPGTDGRIFPDRKSGGRAARGGTFAPSINLGGITITHHGDADSLVETIKEKIEAGLRESVRSLYADYGLEEPG